MHTPETLVDLAWRELRAGSPDNARKLARAAARRGAVEPARAVLLDLARRQGDTAAMDRLLPRLPSDPAQLKLRWKVDRTLGRVEGTYAAARAYVRAHPEDLDFVRRQAESYLGQGDIAAARAFVADALAHDPDLPEALRLERRLRVADRDPTLPDELLAAPPTDPAERARLVADLVQLGRPADARSLAAGAKDPALRCWSGRFALWAGDTAEARACCAGLPGREAARVVAAAGVLEGRADVASLEALVASDPGDGVAWAWLAEALEAAGRFIEAEDAAESAMRTSGGFSVAARLTRAIANAQSRGRGTMMLRATGTAELAPLLGLRGARLGVKELRAARARFGGNRTTTLTTVESGQLRHYAPPADPRDMAQRAQKILATRGPAAALAAQDALHDRFPGHPLLHTYRGEFHLWLGEYARAAQEFEASLAGDRETKWAWIGLGATRLLQGDPQAALDTLDEGVGVTGFAGPTLWIYQAEAHLRLGRRGAGLAALHTARDTKPRRLATWAHLALLAAEDGHSGPSEALCRLVEERLPGLAHDTGPGTPVARIERWFTLWRGNRSSSLITWAGGDGRTRTGSWRGIPPELVATYPPALRGG
jgi:predicted Zn-dependent protease